MNLLSIAGLKLLNFIIGLLPDFDLSLPVVDNISAVSNIFAWVNFFLPSELILTLLTILAGYYTFRLIYNLLIATKDILL